MSDIQAILSIIYLISDESVVDEPTRNSVIALFNESNNHDADKLFHEAYNLRKDGINMRNIYNMMMTKYRNKS